MTPNKQQLGKWGKIGANTLYTAFTAVEIFGLYKTLTNGAVDGVKGLETAGAILGLVVWICLATPTVLQINGCIGKSKATTLNTNLLNFVAEDTSTVVNNPIGSNNV